MKKMLLAMLGVALICGMAANAYATPANHNGKFALHVAGPHDAKVNTCDFVMTDCTTIVTEADVGRFDIYALAIDVVEVTGARFGLRCEELDPPAFFFYGWTLCGDLEIPTEGWPGCGEGNAITWSPAVTIPHVTMGILDVYVYGTNARMCMAEDPRVGFAEFCDDSQPAPECNKVTEDAAFGCVGVLRPGYNPCGEVPVERSSWGAVKSLYR